MDRGDLYMAPDASSYGTLILFGSSTVNGTAKVHTRVDGQTAAQDQIQVGTATVAATLSVPYAAGSSPVFQVTTAQTRTAAGYKLVTVLGAAGSALNLTAALPGLEQFGAYTSWTKWAGAGFFGIH
jgi:hypothetical protein